MLILLNQIIDYFLGSKISLPINYITLIFKTLTFNEKYITVGYQLKTYFFSNVTDYSIFTIIRSEIVIENIRYIYIYIYI